MRNTCMILLVATFAVVGCSRKKDNKPGAAAAPDPPAVAANPAAPAADSTAVSNGTGPDAPAVEKARDPIRFDGVYAATASQPEQRHYLRFTPGGVWIGNSKKGPAEAAAWLVSEQNARPTFARYEVADGELRIEHATYRRQGNVAGDRSSLELRPAQPKNTSDPATPPPEPRQYEFVAVDSLALPGEAERHLARCYETFQELLQSIDQPSGSDGFFRSMEKLADWIEMTPSHRQRLTDPAHIGGTPIAKLHGRSLGLLTPAGGMPLPQLMANHERFKGTALRIIKTQFENERNPSFFISWLLQSTPPPLVIGVLQEVIAVTPRTDLGAKHLEMGMSGMPLQVIPGGMQVVMQLQQETSPAFQALGARLAGGPAARPRPAGSASNSSAQSPSPSPDPKSGQRKPPTRRPVAELYEAGRVGPWQVVTKTEAEVKSLESHTAIESAKGAYRLRHTATEGEAAFQYSPVLSGDGTLRFQLKAEPLDGMKRRREVRVQIYPVEAGAVPFYTVLVLSDEPREETTEVRNADGQATCWKNDQQIGSKSNVGADVRVQLVLRGDVGVEVRMVSMDPLPLAENEPQPPLREIDLLTAAAPEIQDSQDLVARFGPAIVEIEDGNGTRHGGLVISASGLVLTSSSAVRTGAISVYSAEAIETALPAKLLAVDPTRGLALLRIEATSVYPAVSLAGAPASSEAEDAWVVRFDSEGEASVLPFVASRSEGSTGHALFGNDGRVKGVVVGSDADSDSPAVADVRTIVESLVEWCSVKAADRAIRRTWSDASGSFSVLARLVQITPDQVVLERQGGERITVPRDRFSPFDRFLIEAIEARQPE